MSQDILNSAMEVYITVVAAIAPSIIVLSVIMAAVRIFFRAVTKGRV